MTMFLVLFEGESWTRDTSHDCHWGLYEADSLDELVGRFREESTAGQEEYEDKYGHGEYRVDIYDQHNEGDVIGSLSIVDFQHVTKVDLKPWVEELHANEASEEGRGAEKKDRAKLQELQAKYG